MPIYEAEFLGDPTPIKTKKTKKVKDVPEVTVEENKTPVEAPWGLNKKGQPYKRKPKDFKEDVKEEAPPVKKQKVQEPTPSESSVEEKPKRVRKPKVEKPAEMEEIVEESPNIEKPKKITKKDAKAANKKIIVDGEPANEPPTWFKAYLHDEAKRRNQEKSKKERMPQAAVKHEAEVKATEKWNDGLVRDRVTNEVNSHMNRLYSQIHGRRF